MGPGTLPGWARGRLLSRWTVERTFAWLGKCRRLSRDREHPAGPVTSRGSGPRAGSGAPPSRRGRLAARHHLVPRADQYGDVYGYLFPGLVGVEHQAQPVFEPELGDAHDGADLCE